MKRHPSLQQLSRDHHHALVVAQALKRAKPETAAAAREGFLDYWTADGREHFREEEEILLPTFAGFANPDQPVVARVLIEHVLIRHLADDVAADSPPLECLHRLGTELEHHIRREERELFPLIEQALPEADLARLAALLARASE